MPHRIYHSEAIIVGSVSTGEANRFLRLLTPDLGLLWCMAQGVREQKSKLRYGLQTFSHARVDLVRGRELWRLTSAEPIQSFFRIARIPAAAAVYDSSVRILARLIAGQSPHHPEIFEETLAALRFLDAEELSPKELGAFQTLFAARTLRHLGYWAERAPEQSIFRSSWSPALLASAVPLLSDLSERIAESLQESHL